MTRTVNTLLVALSGLSVFCLWFFPLNPIIGETFGLFAFALILEMGAIHMPTLGFVSASFPIFFVLGFSPHAGPASTTLGLMVVLALRSMFRSGNNLNLTALEFLIDAFSITSALVVGGILSKAQVLKIDDFPVSLLALLAALLTYSTLTTKLYALVLAQLKVSKELYLAQVEATSIQVRASAMSAPALLLLVQQGAWHILWTLPVFLAFYQSNWDRLSELREARAEKNRATGQSLRKDKVLLRAAKSMAELQSQKRLIHNCSANFSKTRCPKESFSALLQILRRIVSLQSVAVALVDGQSLKPYLCQSPYQVNFSQQPKPEIRENLIIKAWTSGEVQRFDSADASQRIFKDEKHAVAFPLHGQGVLYLGSSTQTLDGETFQNLAIVAYQFSLSLQSTLREEALVSSLVHLQEANTQIALGRERLLQILQGSHKMTRKLDAEHILEEASRTLSELFRPSFLLISVHNGHTLSQGAAPPSALLEKAQSELTESEDTFYLKTFEQTNQKVAFMGHRLASDAESLGFVLMASEQREHFSKAQRRFFELLALHCSVMLTNSTLFNDVTQARKDLVESQAQLVQSSKLAAVGQLAAGVAHELNTPLGAILLSIQSASRQLCKGRYDKVAGRLEDGIKGAEIAKDIVDKLLFYSREAREDGVKVCLGDIIQDTIRFLGSQIEIENIELHTTVNHECWVQGNQNELQQILTNLLVNARDAIKESGTANGRIDIVLSLSENEATLEVKDNGPGFTEETASRAFEPFFTTKPIGQGTGLGLHVSRQIAERHQGRLELHSTFGQGSTVALVLPAQERLS